MSAYDLYDVIAVNLSTQAERVIASGKTKENADAIMHMAVIRRGVDDEFFVVRSHRQGSAA